MEFAVAQTSVAMAIVHLTHLLELLSIWGPRESTDLHGDLHEAHLMGSHQPGPFLNPDCQGHLPLNIEARCDEVLALETF